MPELAFLDVLIALVTVYLVLALAVTTATELLAQAFQFRANTFQDGLVQLLDDHDDKKKPGALWQRLLRAASFRSVFPDSGPVTREVLNSPVLKQLGSRPSYVPPEKFALALAETLRKNPGLKSGLLEWLPAPVGKPADTSNAASRDVLVEAQFIRLFNDAMERVSGWYKRRVQTIALFLSAVLVVALNADTLDLVQHLQTDTALREALVAEAEKAAASEDELPIESDDLTSASFSFEWSAPDGTAGWISKVAGLLLTTLAVSMGAPFWFDTLSRIMSIRGAGKNPSERREA